MWRGTPQQLLDRCVCVCMCVCAEEVDMFLIFHLSSVWLVEIEGFDMKIVKLSFFLLPYLFLIVKLSVFSIQSHHQVTFKLSSQLPNLNVLLGLFYI